MSIAQKKRGSSSQRTHDANDTISLFRALVSQVDQSEHGEHNGSAESVSGPTVLLDLVMDDVHYTLTRKAEPEANQEQEEETHLSPREQEIVRLVAKGLPNKTIAAVLDISIWTVATHLRRIFGKLGVHSRAEMVAEIIGQGQG